jgi:curved DNA-binding protein CbpA
MPEQSYYDILQVSPSAEMEVIVAAYRRLAFKYHPDRNSDPASQQKMRLLIEAYEVLSDPNQRAAYDTKQKNKPDKQASGQESGIVEKPPLVEASPYYPPPIRESFPAIGSLEEEFSPAKSRMWLGLLAFLITGTIAATLLVVVFANRPKARVAQNAKPDKPSPKQSEPKIIIPDPQPSGEKNQPGQDSNRNSIGPHDSAKPEEEKLLDQEKPDEKSENKPERKFTYPAPIIPFDSKPREKKKSEQEPKDLQVVVLTTAEKRILDRFNSIRKNAGLGHVVVDSTLQRGCQGHAEYLVDHPEQAQRNPHEEDPDLLGFTEEGSKAARNSVISISFGNLLPSWDVDSVDGFIGTLFLRIPMLDPRLKRIGIGVYQRKQGAARCGTVLINVQDGKEDLELDDSPIIYPADQQQGVPLVLSTGGLVTQNQIPGVTETTGFPITATIYSDVLVKNEGANLFSASGTRIPCWLSGSNKPIPGAYGNQQNTICLIPKEELASSSHFKAVFEAEVNGKQWKKTWTFTTRSKPRVP